MGGWGMINFRFGNFFIISVLFLSRVGPAAWDVAPDGLPVLMPIDVSWMSIHHETSAEDLMVVKDHVETKRARGAARWTPGNTVNEVKPVAVYRDGDTKDTNVLTLDSVAKADLAWYFKLPPYDQGRVVLQLQDGTWGWGRLRALKLDLARSPQELGVQVVVDEFGPGPKAYPHPDFRTVDVKLRHIRDRIWPMPVRSLKPTGINDLRFFVDHDGKAPLSVILYGFRIRDRKELFLDLEEALKASENSLGSVQAVVSYRRAMEAGVNAVSVYQVPFEVLRFALAGERDRLLEEDKNTRLEDASTWLENMWTYELRVPPTKSSEGVARAVEDQLIRILPRKAEEAPEAPCAESIAL
jgi:hypothetical protein